VDWDAQSASVREGVAVSAVRSRTLLCSGIRTCPPSDDGPHSVPAAPPLWCTLWPTEVYITPDEQGIARIRASVEVRTIADALRIYRCGHHRWPTRGELAASDAGRDLGELRDPWDHPYELRRGDEPNTMIVRCLGPDGVEATEDDFVVTVR
jgi:hypothetical protein